MKKYLIYDGRYHSEPEKAVVMSICETKEEAEREKVSFGDDCVIVEEDLTESAKKLI
jgi:hypothetical protein